MTGEGGEPRSPADVVELARCVVVNLENIRPVAEALPHVGIAWAQATALAKIVANQED